MRKIFTAGTLAVLLCSTLAAQAPTQNPPSATPSAAPASQARPDGDTQTPAPAPAPAAAQSSPKGDTFVVQGCIQPSVVAVSATPDAVGTAGRVSTSTAFILASAMKPAGTSGSSATSSSPVASTYQLDVEDSKLIPHVGHQVEISGTLARPDNTASPAGAASASTIVSPTIKVQNVRMLAATCTP